MVHLQPVAVRHPQPPRRPGAGHSPLPHRGGDQRRHALREHLPRAGGRAGGPDDPFDGGHVLDPHARRVWQHFRIGHPVADAGNLWPHRARVHRDAPLRGHRHCDASRLLGADLPGRQVLFQRPGPDVGSQPVPRVAAASGAQRLHRGPFRRRGLDPAGGRLRDPLQDDRRQPDHEGPDHVFERAPDGGGVVQHAADAAGRPGAVGPFQQPFRRRQLESCRIQCRCPGGPRADPGPVSHAHGPDELDHVHQYRRLGRQRRRTVGDHGVHPVRERAQHRGLLPRVQGRDGRSARRQQQRGLRAHVSRRADPAGAALLVGDRIHPGFDRADRQPGGQVRGGQLRAGAADDSDGSISIYIATQLPSGVPAANWLPVSSGRFNVMLRVYGPEGSVADNTYVPPGIERNS